MTQTLFVNHGGGYVDNDYLDHARRTADFTPSADPLVPSKGVLSAQANDCNCGCHEHEQMAINHGFTDEPLKIGKGVLS